MLAGDPGRLEWALSRLRASLGDRVSTAAAARDQHGRDESWHPPCPPDAVCYAESTEEVAEIRAVQAAPTGRRARRTA